MLATGGFGSPRESSSLFEVTPMDVLEDIPETIRDSRDSTLLLIFSSVSTHGFST